MAVQKVDNRVVRRITSDADDSSGDLPVYVKVEDFGGETDNVIYIDQPDGVYKRVYSGCPDIKWWGAVCDGTTDDTEAVAAAIVSAEQFNLTLGFYSGDCLISEDTEFTNPIAFFNGAKITSSSNFRFRGVIAMLVYCLNISGNIIIEKNEKIYPQWFGAMGDAKASGGTINALSNQLTLTSTNYFEIGDILHVLGAGTGGAILQTTVTNIVGSVLTLANAAVTSVANKGISTRNDTVALQRFFKSVQSVSNTIEFVSDSPSNYGCSKLFVPRGTYVSFDKVNMYNGCVLEGEYGNVQSGSILIQANISLPLINVIADNFDLEGVSMNGGNGNNLFRDLKFKSAHIDDANENSPIVYFQNAWNNHSDTQFKHVTWQNTAGFCIGAGFKTTGTGNSGQAVLVLANGSTFRSNGSNIGGARITIVGAGAAGADLNTYIISGGGTNTVTLATNILSPVTNTAVYPQEDEVGIRLTDCEFDVCRGGIAFEHNVTGDVFLNVHIGYQCIRGLYRKTSRREVEFNWADGYMWLCGNYNDATVNRRYSIYVTNSLGADASIVKLNNVQTLREAGFGSSLQIENAETFFCDGGFFDGSDSVDFGKFIYLAGVNNVFITKNHFRNGIANKVASYTNARIVSISNPNPHKIIDVLDNFYENLDSGTFENFIQSDYSLVPANISGNSFKGNATTPIHSNISGNNVRNNCQSIESVVRYGTAVPSAGTWKVDDIQYNSTPSTAGFIGWVCVTAGTPGTWRVFGEVPQETYGLYTASGDGIVTTFNIAHGLGQIPTLFQVSPANLASRNFSATADATNIIILYETAPVAGVNNVRINWYAKYRATPLI